MVNRFINNRDSTPWSQLFKNIENPNLQRNRVRIHSDQTLHRHRICAGLPSSGRCEDWRAQGLSARVADSQCSSIDVSSRKDESSQLVLCHHSTITQSSPPPSVGTDSAVCTVPEDILTPAALLTPRLYRQRTYGRSRLPPRPRDKRAAIRSILRLAIFYISSCGNICNESIHNAAERI